MGTHIARYEHNERAQWAAVVGGQLRPIAGEYPSLAHLLADGRAAIDAAAGSAQSLPANTVRLLCPVTGPCSIVCQGLNYSSHRQEAGRTVHKPPFNLMFTKAWSSLSGPQDVVVRPKGVNLLDYELELGLVIGTPIEAPTTITNQNLHTVVAGVVITNDVSARDVQIPQQQWFKGKSFRTFCPAGPYLYLLYGPDDAAKILNLDIELTVNGASRQKANTSQLLYGPAETLTELSRIMNLYPGDLVLTGTPGGVAIKAPSHRAQRIARIFMDEAQIMKTFLKRQAENPNYLKDGDVIRCSMRSPDGTIDLGEMKTTIVSKA